MNKNIDTSNETINYHYIFKLSNGKKKELSVKLNAKTLKLIRKQEEKPEWTKLKYSKCRICPLDEERHEFCPVAVNLVELIDIFGDLLSYEKADILIETKERNFSKYTTLQKGLSSLIGIYMVTSGCPIMERLKPMVRYHLPFATEEETAYRVLSMYLAGQYFLSRKGSKADFNLEKLMKFYDDIHSVNKDMCERLRSVSKGDAGINAVIILDTFAIEIPLILSERIENLFSAYFE